MGTGSASGSSVFSSRLNGIWVTPSSSSSRFSVVFFPGLCSMGLDVLIGVCASSGKPGSANETKELYII